MKVRSLCSVALIATLGVTVLGTATPAFAEGDPTSSGTVTVTEGGGGGSSTGTVDPENPDKILPEINEVNTNGDTGALIIEKTSNLNFGQIETAADTVTAYASELTFTESGATKKRGSILQWVDVRAGGTYGYTITAEMTQQFTSTTSAGVKTLLAGATIDYANGFFTPQSGNTNVVPSSSTAAFQLKYDGTSNAQTVVTASKTNKEGKGRYVMAFGQTNEGATPAVANSTANSVKLTVPAATAANMLVTGSENSAYNAIVTWKITAAE